MTPSSYFTALIAKTFGLHRRNKRLNDASQEMSLLRDAEYHLGVSVWKEIDHINELSVEYWNLRKYTKELDVSRERRSALSKDLKALEEERATILKEISIEQKGLEETSDKLMSRMQELTEERDSIVREARDLRRALDGMEAKIGVLKEHEEATSAIVAVESEIEESKAKFLKLRESRQKIATLIQRGDEEIDEIDAKLKVIIDEKKQRAAVVYAKIGDLNREISALLSASGTIEVQLKQLFSEIGRYISRYDLQDPACAAVAKKEKTLVAVMRMLRLSISLNHKLADFN